MALSQDRAFAIFMYHAVVETPLEVFDSCFITAELFRRHMENLRKIFNFVLLSEALERLEQRSVGRRTAVITFDDGFLNNYEVAFPILCELGIPATIFAATGFIGRSDTVWFCHLNRAVTKTGKSLLHWQGNSYPLKTPRERRRSAWRLQCKLKGYPHDRLLMHLRDILCGLGIDPDEPLAPDSPYRMLSSEAILAMAKSGLVEFGAHTRSHAILSKLSLEDQQREISTSTEKLESITGKPCTLFAYPNGSFRDFNDYTVSLLQQYGIRAAVTSEPGLNHTARPKMKLRRFGIDVRMPPAMMKLWASSVAFRQDILHRYPHLKKAMAL